MSPMNVRITICQAWIRIRMLRFLESYSEAYRGLCQEILSLHYRRYLHRRQHLAYERPFEYGIPNPINICRVINNKITDPGFGIESLQAIRCGLRS
jgi:hypothetical protein